jgi:hypothetical protein
MHEFSQIYFGYETLHVSDSSSVHHQELLLYTQQWYMSYVICHHDDGQRNCPKHVEFYSKNKFEKLVPLVGFVIRIYHDARSS